MTQEEIQHDINAIRKSAGLGADRRDFERIIQLEIALQLCRIADGLEAVTGTITYNLGGGTVKAIRTDRA